MLPKEEYEFPYELEFLPIGWLVLDAVSGPLGRGLSEESRRSFQRIQDGVMKRIIVKGLKKHLLQPLVVNRRSSQVNSILDGGGRFRAILDMIEREEIPVSYKVPCLVTKVSVDEEPVLFIELNVEKLGLKQYDIFIGRVAAQDEDYVRMDEIVRSATGGLKVGGGKKDFQSVDSIKTIYFRDDGPEDLRYTLRLLSKANWFELDRGTNGAVIGAVGKLVNQHNPHHTEDFFLAGLQATTPRAVLSEAGIYSPGGGGSRKLGMGAGKVLAETLNRVNRCRKGTKKWIDPEQFLSETALAYLQGQRAAS